MPKAQPKPATLTVRAVGQEIWRVVLDDEDSRHPGGYTRIVGDGQPHQVGDTPRVQELIAAGELEIVPDAG